MVKLRYIMCLVFIAILSTTLITGCGNDSEESQSQQGDQLQVVTSFYPLYYLVSEIGGEHVNVEQLVATGVDPHDWSPKSQDIKNIIKADAFLYLGAGFEGWVPDILSGIESDSDVHVVETSNGLDLIHLDDDHEGEEHHEDEASEHQEEEEHHEDEASGHNHSHSDIDPHVWTSPKQAIELADQIKLALIEIDPDHKDDYEANFSELSAELEEIDQAFESMVQQANRKEFVVSHQAYSYIARDYGLVQQSIMGLSPEQEPTSQQLIEIQEFIQANNIKYILFEDLTSPELAETIAEDLNLEVMALNPLEGLTEEQQQNGDDFLSLMRDNVNVLEQVLQ
ncbi:metal ABC transporter solute-binding protein, Zn/Mn family [Longirhabdus pacifica]|uniref:metal ABC transporter solute-binding protein, Zn/Mn family n=1 Tax=Longirhabdus pacifica TaxID=2305227 RepID=UPI001008CDBE|nr:zinc ABC transporter substrate-binding protein [Longirhabdus pacifica]